MNEIVQDQNKLLFLKGIGYLTFSKIIIVILSFFFTYICANYLGPDNYGVFNYAIGLITLFIPSGPATIIHSSPMTYLKPMM